MLTKEQKVRYQAPLDASQRRFTRHMPTESARKAVFDTSELLERIIVHLPMKDIFIIQRVSHQFQNIIATSPEIQTKLFLRLKNQPREAWKIDDRSEHGIRRLGESEKREGEIVSPVALNPLLVECGVPSYMSHAVIHRPAKWTGPQSVKMDFDSAHLGEHPSFLKMYITDPPCYTAMAGMSVELLLDPEHTELLDSDDTTAVGVAMNKDDGLTLGDIIHAKTDVELQGPSTGYLCGEDVSLAQMIAATDCEVIVEPESHPVCTLLLFDVCFPTDEERAAITSGRNRAIA